MGRRRQSTPLLGAMAAAWLAAGVSAPVGAADLAAPGAEGGIDIAALAPPESPPTLLPAPDTVHLHVLEVTVNALPVGTWEVLERDGGYWVTAEALQAWRVLLPAAARPQMSRQRLWWPLFAVPGYRAQFDAARQTLELEVLADALAPTAVGAAPAARPVLSTPMPAAFVNYDIAWTEARGAGAAQSDRGLLTEAGLSGSAGVLLSTQVLRWLRSQGSPGATESRRLETSWTRDWPQHELTLRVGDSWTRMSTWGRQAAFGGVQVGTQRTQWRPGAGMARPVLSGSALTASTVELYVNESLRQKLQVPPGPFTLENTAPLAGAGEARLVVRDLLGRETVIVRPFFIDPQLMEPGLADWSVEAGRVRRDLGLGTENDGYGDAFAQAWGRLGVRPELTLESRLQAQARTVHLGAAASVAVASRALMQLALAGSSSEGRGGGSALLTLQSHGARDGFALRLAGSSRDHVEVGRPAFEQPPRIEASLAWRAGIGQADALGANIATLRRHDGAAVSTGALSYTQRLPGWGHLVWSASRIDTTAPGSVTTPAPGRGHSTSLQVLALLPLQGFPGGGRPVATAQLQRQRGADGQSRIEALVSAYGPIASDTAWGWRALAGRRAGQAAAEAGLQRQADRVLLGVDVSAIESQATTVRATAQGAFVLAEGRLLAARRIEDSFALVEVPGHADVGVGLDGPPVTQTDAQGLALLPRLTAFQPNRVRLDPNGLPADAEIDTIELEAVPPWRSAVKLRFPVREGRAALLSFLVAGDQPAPRGAVLSLEAEAREFVVAGRGEVYVSGLPPGQPRRATLRWQGQACEVEVVWSRPRDEAAAALELPRLGPWRCPGMQP